MPPRRSQPKKDNPAIKDSLFKSSSNEYTYSDPIKASLEFLYQPHTMSAMILVIVGLIYMAFFKTVKDAAVNGVR